MAQTRLAVLDGLRGLAVLLVLWYHVWEISWLPAPWRWLQFVPETGFIGVDLFFFISGFVIVYPFVKALVNGDVLPTWGVFAYRRALKIVPSYVLSIAVCAAVGYWQLSGDAARQLVTHLLFIHTWFPDTAGGINGVLWTLAAEVEFYAAFPVFWLLFRRVPYLTALAMIGLAIAFRVHVQACCMSYADVNLLETLPSYLDTFAFGMICAYVYVRYRESLHGAALRAFATIAAIAGLAWLAVMLHHLWDVRYLPDWGTFAIYHRTPVAAAFALTALGSLLAYRWWQSIFSNRVMMFLAFISYNLYLYHQVVARLLLGWNLPPHHGDPHYDTSWQLPYSIAAFAAAIAWSALVTYTFERPLLAVPPERARRWFLSPLRRIGALPRS